MIDYTVTYNTQGNRLLPPAKRLPKIKSWLFALLAPIQWLHNLFFINYIGGQPIDTSYTFFWDSGDTYLKGQRVISVDNFTVWECIVTSSTSVDPLSLGQTDWQKVLDDWIGVNERVVYTSKVLQLEYILNKRFARYGFSFLNWNFVDTTNWVRKSPYSDIYITPLNNRYFVIYDTPIGATIWNYPDPSVIPIYDTASYPLNFASFQINVPTYYLALITEKGIRSIADKYVIAGIIYTVVGY